MTSLVLLVTVPGFSETMITAQDYAVDSDVVLESSAREIKSIPKDTINAVGDTVKFTLDETTTVVNGVNAALAGASAHEKAQKAGELAVENAWDSSNDILFRSYKVSDEIGELLLTGTTGQDSAPSIDVSGFFDGINFPANASAYYMPKLKHLLVRQTMGNILDIENVLADYQGSERELLGHQVEIETKFVEVNQKTLNELGFSWQFESQNGGDWGVGGDWPIVGDVGDISIPGQDILASGLRTAAGAIGGAADSLGVLSVGSAASESLQWDLFISAVERSDDSDVLSAPRVVVLDGSTATIQVGEEQMVPKSFDINHSDTSPFVEHADWDLELMGVFMEVTPELREEGLIDLELHPKVVEIIGYDTYTVMDGYTFASRTFSVDASLPYFRVREMETRVTVADGSTIGMGGLTYDKLETFRDKVPVLGSIPYIGRLFRSEGERSIKRNLMIFVTATQVDIDGRRSADVVLKK